MLSFIHLSDIHFSKYSGDPYDIDEDLRNELVKDISSEFKKKMPTADGILICGDIAFSGDKQQYDIASAFLNNICEVIDIDKSHVFCVPGNHDVDQKATSGQITVKLLQRDLDRLSSVDEYDAALASIFRTPIDLEAICAPILNYNNFATKYGCSFEQQPTWKQEIAIDKDFTLCIFGINSAITSNETDHKQDNTERLMHISRMQIPQRKKNTVYLSLCHHPPECWVDPEGKLCEKMDARIAVQLYGHKHLQTIRQTSSGVIVGSGATHPSRFEEGWIPRYNWIAIDIKHNGKESVLNIRIYPRILDNIESKFIPDKSLEGESCYVEYYFPLNVHESDNIEAQMPVVEVEAGPAVLPVESWERRFIYDFMNLPFFSREKILKDISLTINEDEGKRHAELLGKIMERARKKNCVSQLIERVNEERERIEQL